MNKEIDVNAPLTARKEVIIESPVDKIWKIQTDIEGWQKWQPDVTSARLESTISEGAGFHWKAKGLDIVSNFHTVEPQHRIGWTGKSLGMFAIHNWTFEPVDSGTRVITEESLSGWLARLMKLFDPKFLEKSLENSLNTLKAYVENNAK
jgi:uncharacterized protein YndB with AHSA1/START domain